MTSDKVTLRFVKLLVGGASAKPEGDAFVIDLVPGRPKLRRSRILVLLSAGLVRIENGSCTARPEARAWLKRQMVDHDHHAAQHRTLSKTRDIVQLNLGESPLAKLASSANGKPAYIAPHHLLAGERIRTLVEKAHLVQRVTMSYDPTRVPSSTGGSARTSVSDMAMDARRTLARLGGLLPKDCEGVVLDVCGYLKGLQQVEAERQWPRRSAKLVLRIGLDQAAQFFGYSPVASGAESQRDHTWLGENARPTQCG